MFPAPSSFGGADEQNSIESTPQKKLIEIISEPFNRFARTLLYHHDKIKKFVTFDTVHDIEKFNGQRFMNGGDVDINFLIKLCKFRFYKIWFSGEDGDSGTWEVTFLDENLNKLHVYSENDGI